MSKKNLDQQNRFRNKVIAFRVSDEENEVLNAKVKMSGLNKQDYLIACCNDKDILVLGNPYVYKNLRNQLNVFIRRFKEISALNELTLDEIIILENMLSIIIALKENKKTQIKSNNKGAPEK